MLVDDTCIPMLPVCIHLCLYMQDPITPSSLHPHPLPLVRTSYLIPIKAFEGAGLLPMGRGTFGKPNPNIHLHPHLHREVTA